MKNERKTESVFIVSMFLIQYCRYNLIIDDCPTLAEFSEIIGSTPLCSAYMELCEPEEIPDDEV